MFNHDESHTGEKPLECSDCLMSLYETERLIEYLNTLLMNNVKSKKAENNDHTKKLSESHIANKTPSKLNANDETLQIKKLRC